jgi:uncharacterized protein (DUF2252 family)
MIGFQAAFLQQLLNIPQRQRISTIPADRTENQRRFCLPSLEDRRSRGPVELLVDASRDRLPELLPIKWARMAASPFGFFRGAVPLMAADLASLPTTGITVQICGDAHVRNLGAFASPTGAVVFDINDFDETIPGPWEWDVKRLAVSLMLSGREAGQSDSACKEAVVSFVAEYGKSVNYCSELTVLEIARYTVHRHMEAGPLPELP